MNSGVKGPFFAAWILFLGYITITRSFYVIGLPLLLSWPFFSLNTIPIYSVAGTPAYLPWLLVGFAGPLFFFYVNYRGIKFAQGFQMVMFLMLLGIGAIALVVALAKRSGNLLLLKEEMRTTRNRNYRQEPAWKSIMTSSIRWNDFPILLFFFLFFYRGLR